MAISDWFEHKEAKAEDDEYDTVTVKKGDSLWKIAEEITGDGSRWKELADANPQHTWTETYVIQPGDELKVPKSWSADASEAKE